MNALTSLRWDLADGSAFQRSFEGGLRIGSAVREAQDRRETRAALAAVAANPDDPAAMAAIFERNPELGMKLMDRADSRAFNRDMGEYLAPGGQPNALLGAPAQAPQTPNMPSVQPNALVNALNPMPPVRPGAGFNEAFSPVSDPQPASMPEMRPPGDQPDQPDLSMLGEPQNGRDQAFLRMVQRDPVKALKIQSTLRDNFVDRIKNEREFYGLAVEALSTVQDDAGWQAALQRLVPMSQALGTDLTATVPLNYPGPDAVNQLLERAMPVKQQLDHFAKVANIEADNERSDRNTDSMIEVRERRAGEYERANKAREGNARRGQDLTDKRARTGSRGSPREKLPVISSPAEARKLPSGTKFRTPDGKVKIVP